MISFPQCKINIGLNIHYKRDDNFHEISSVMYPVPINDVIEIVRSDEFKFTSSGLTIPGSEKDNLCVSAYDLIRDEYGIGPVHIHLYKNIPMGGGLGGGSSDATEVLKMLNDEFELEISTEELKQLAGLLGSDCPFFVDNNPQLAYGRGEKLKPIELDLNGYYLVLINDGTHVSTKEAYSKVLPSIPQQTLMDQIKLPVDQWKDQIRNQFEQSIFPLYNHLDELKEALYAEGAVYASMTGSGATMYGLFREQPLKIEDRFGHLNLCKIIEL